MGEDTRCSPTGMGLSNCREQEHRELPIGCNTRRSMSTHCREAVFICKQRGCTASADAADAIENQWWERVRFENFRCAVGPSLLGLLRCS